MINDRAAVDSPPHHPAKAIGSIGQDVNDRLVQLIDLFIGNNRLLIREMIFEMKHGKASHVVDAGIQLTGPGSRSDIEWKGVSGIIVALGHLAAPG